MIECDGCKELREVLAEVIEQARYANATRANSSAIYAREAAEREAERTARLERERVEREANPWLIVTATNRAHAKTNMPVRRIHTEVVEMVNGRERRSHFDLDPGGIEAPTKHYTRTAAWEKRLQLDGELRELLAGGFLVVARVEDDELCRRLEREKERRA